jgi:hypothetical protein
MKASISTVVLFALSSTALSPINHPLMAREVTEGPQAGLLHSKSEMWTGKSAAQQNEFKLERPGPKRPNNGITCANVRCAGPCRNTPEGPRCDPRNNDGPKRRSSIMSCANVRCAGACMETADGPQCTKEDVEDPTRKSLRYATTRCANGYRPLGQDCIPAKDFPVTCANVRCAGHCTNTPNGPRCNPVKDDGRSQHPAA